MAQKKVILSWLKHNYPKRKIFEFSYLTSTRFNLWIVNQKIKPVDLIFLHSGYLMIDHHKELPIFQEIVRRFRHNKIIILPQTINLKDEKVINKTVTVFNLHPQLTLLCRDKKSYRHAQKLFHNAKIFLYPDVVTSLIGEFKFNFERNKILFCIRNDIEAFYNKDEINSLRNRLEKFIEIVQSDTSIPFAYPQIEKKENEIIEEAFKEFATYKLVITDRYHGTIFSLIAGTPVIVIKTNDHKVISGVDWFTEHYSSYICFAKDLEEAYTFALEYLNFNKRKPLHPYFKEKYYSTLKEII